MKPKDNAKYIVVTKSYHIAVAELKRKSDLSNWFKQQTSHKREDLAVLPSNTKIAYLPLF